MKGAAEGLKMLGGRGTIKNTRPLGLLPSRPKFGGENALLAPLVLRALNLMRDE